MNTTYFQHLFVGSGHLTIAAKKAKHNKAVGGFAWCSPQDQFNKRLGRTIAEGRMYSRSCMFFDADEDFTAQQVLERARNIILEGRRPKWARDGASEREIAHLTKLLSARFGMEDLDEHVHELKMCEAKAINNSSFEEQVRYLVEQAGADWVRDTFLEKP